MMPHKPFMVTVILLVVACAISGYAAHRPVPVVVATNLEKLPMEIAGYKGTDDTFPDSVYKELNADKHVYRHYRAPDGSVIDLYIGYYGTAKGGRTGHNPRACLPGSGAVIVEAENVFLKQTSSNSVVPVNYLVATKEGGSTVLLHWYQGAGNTVLSSGLKQNMQRLISKAVYNRNDGAFVRLTACDAMQPVAEVKEKLTRFAEVVLNLLPNYWPLER